MSEKLTRNFQTRAAGNYHSQENVDMMKAARNGTLAKTLTKTGGFAIAVDWPSVNALLGNQDTDGVRQELDETVKEIERQTIHPRGGWHTLSVAEKESLRAQIIEGMLGGDPAPAWFVVLVNIAVRLKPDFDVPMPSHGGKAAGGDLAKADKYGVMAEATEAIDKLSENLRRRKANGESDTLRKVNDVHTASLAQQVEELTKRIVAIIKARTCAPAPAPKPAAAPRFVPRQTGDVQEADLTGATKKRAPGSAFVPQR
jgi:hypothetical protein